MNLFLINIPPSSYSCTFLISFYSFDPIHDLLNSSWTCVLFHWFFSISIRFFVCSLVVIFNICFWTDFFTRTILYRNYNFLLYSFLLLLYNIFSYFSKIFFFCFIMLLSRSSLCKKNNIMCVLIYDNFSYFIVAILIFFLYFFIFLTCGLKYMKLLCVLLLLLPLHCYFYVR